MKKNKEKKYKVTLSMRYSHELSVTASNKWLAKTKAYLKLLGKLTQKDFTIYIDEEE